ncbi:MAG: SH3 domain-containing C40 family peptidase, partial [Angelakisella sp.]
MEKLIVRAAVAPLYESPRAGALLADELLCGMSAELLEESGGGLVRVRSFYGYEGYGARESFSTEGAEEWGRREKLIVTWSYDNVQQQPSVRSPVSLSLPRGSLCAGKGPSVLGWQEVRLAGGGEGFIQAVHLAPYPMGGGLAGDKLRLSLCQNALSYMGCCYRWGGKTPLGIDCSGLCSQVYLNHGIGIYRDAVIAGGYPVHEIPFAELRPADLLYFRGHMALWLGDGRYIHSSASSGGVTASSFTEGDAGYRNDLSKGL